MLVTVMAMADGSGCGSNVDVVVGGAIAGNEVPDDSFATISDDG